MSQSHLKQLLFTGLNFILLFPIPLWIRILGLTHLNFFLILWNIRGYKIMTMKLWLRNYVKSKLSLNHQLCINHYNIASIINSAFGFLHGEKFHPNLPAFAIRIPIILTFEIEAIFIGAFSQRTLSQPKK